MGLAEVMAENRQLKTQLAERDSLIAKLQTQVTELERRLGLDSHNSNQPPSSDGVFKKKPQAEKNRAKRKRRKGFHRELVAVEQVDRMVEVRPKQCMHCQRSLHEARIVGRPWRHQVTELPFVRAHITEYRMLKVRCECGGCSRAKLPSVVAQSAFGPRLMAHVAELRSEYRMSVRQVKNVLYAQYGVELSVGEVIGMQRQCAKALEGAYRELESAVHQSTVVHADETPYPLQTKLGWLWVALSDAAVLFRLAAARSKDQAHTLLGPTDNKIVVRDRLGSYGDYPDTQFCHAHLRRLFVQWSEAKGFRKSLGEKLHALQTQMFEQLNRYRAGQASVDEFQQAMKPIEQAFHHWLTQGTRAQEPKLGRQCQKLLQRFKALFRFVHDPERIEPTNNPAEQMLRPAVIARKLSYGVRSEPGARFIERSYSVWQTRKKHRLSFHDYLIEAIEALRLGLPSPPLLPDASPVPLR